MKKLDKFKDMEFLSIEELESTNLCKKKENRITDRKHHRTKKIFLFILFVFLLLVLAAVCTFFYMRWQGEKKLKTEVDAVSSETGRKQGHYILHNGKEYRYKEEIVNILCLGIDKDIPIEEKRTEASLGFADAVLLVSINTSADTMKVLSIPRDTMIPVMTVDKNGEEAGYSNKQITYQYAYATSSAQGGELMCEAVSELLYGVPIQRYCAINFQALPALNDAIGGVDVVVLEDMTWYKSVFVQGATLHLNGELALDYVRQRNEAVFGSSLQRLERQKQYVAAYLSKAKEVVKSNPSLPLTLFEELKTNMGTNITAEDIAYLVPELLSMQISESDMLQLPGNMQQGENYAEFIADETAVKELVISTFYEEVKE